MNILYMAPKLSAARPPFLASLGSYLLWRLGRAHKHVEWAVAYYSSALPPLMTAVGKDMVRARHLGAIPPH